MEESESNIKSDDNQFPKRKRIRADFHDYNGGEYFVTVCTKNKSHYFGKIYDGKMHLSPVGVELQEQLQNIKHHYEYVDIPLFVVMPNHFHAIIIVGPTLVSAGPGRQNMSRNAADMSCGRVNQLSRDSADMSCGPTAGTADCGDRGDSADTSVGPTVRTRLGNIVSALKAGVTRFARRNNIEFGWQYRYHDHIIRGGKDLDNISDYIENNVVRWHADCYFDEL